MALRPHCLKCGSSNVIFDEDVLNGNRSIYCYICGNRQYQGMDYIGFEMREEGSMASRATCKNCKRSDMIIVRKGLCSVCAKASKANPDPGPERDAAMAKVAAVFESLQGPRPYTPRTGAGAPSATRPDRKGSSSPAALVEEDGHAAAHPRSGRKKTIDPKLEKAAAKAARAAGFTADHPDPLTKPAGPATKALLQRGLDALSSSACGKSHNPYIHCPLMFQIEDFAIGQYVTLLVSEVRRISGLSIGGGNHEEAQKIDACISSITAYMNGRIHELAVRLKEGGSHE